MSSGDHRRNWNHDDDDDINNEGGVVKNDDNDSSSNSRQRLHSAAAIDFQDSKQDSKPGSTGLPLPPSVLRVPPPLSNMPHRTLMSSSTYSHYEPNNSMTQQYPISYHPNDSFHRHSRQHNDHVMMIAAQRSLSDDPLERLIQRVLEQNDGDDGDNNKYDVVPVPTNNALRLVLDQKQQQAGSEIGGEQQQNLATTTEGCAVTLSSTAATTSSTSENQKQHQQERQPQQRQKQNQHHHPQQQQQQQQQQQKQQQQKQQQQTHQPEITTMPKKDPHQPSTTKTSSRMKRIPAASNKRNKESDSDNEMTTTTTTTVTKTHRSLSPPKDLPTKVRLLSHPPYHDYANTPDFKKLEEKAVNSKDSFPVLLHSIVELADRSSELYDIIHWNDHGRSFVITDKERFTQTVLSQYFHGQKQYASFHRQLNSYGFLRIVKAGSVDRFSFYHEMFLRGNARLVYHLPRERRHNNRVRVSLDPNTEPDFTKYPPIPLRVTDEANKEASLSTIPKEQVTSSRSASNIFSSASFSDGRSPPSSRILATRQRHQTSQQQQQRSDDANKKNVIPALIQSSGKQQDTESSNQQQQSRHNSIEARPHNTRSDNLETRSASSSNTEDSDMAYFLHDVDL